MSLIYPQAVGRIGQQRVASPRAAKGLRGRDHIPVGMAVSLHHLTKAARPSHRLPGSGGDHLGRCAGTTRDYALLLRGEWLNLCLHLLNYWGSWGYGLQHHMFCLRKGHYTSKGGPARTSCQSRLWGCRPCSVLLIRRNCRLGEHGHKATHLNNLGFYDRKVVKLLAT